MDDYDHSKVFVGRILWETTEENLQDHSRKYETAVGSVIAEDRGIGSHGCFAFLSFSDASALDKVLVDTHTILGRMLKLYKKLDFRKFTCGYKDSRYIHILQTKALPLFGNKAPDLEAEPVFDQELIKELCNSRLGSSIVLAGSTSFSSYTIRISL
ncbi:putative RNA recognition motif domain, nucleotide-binding alpha-beta plait domain superfamily [Helianthus anomalus]